MASPEYLAHAADLWGELADTLAAWVRESREPYDALNQPVTVLPGPNQPQPGITFPR